MRLPHKLRLGGNVELPVAVPMVAAIDKQILGPQSVDTALPHLGAVLGAVIAPGQPGVVLPVNKRKPVRLQVVPAVRVPSVNIGRGRDAVVCPGREGEGADFLRVGACHDAREERGPVLSCRGGLVEACFGAGCVYV